MPFGDVSFPLCRMDHFPTFYTRTPLLWLHSDNDENRRNPRPKTIIFVESDKLIKLVEKYVLKPEMLWCTSTKNEVKIHEIKNDLLLVTYEKKETVVGVAVEELDCHYNHAENIYALVSLPRVTHQDDENTSKPETFIRCLSTQSTDSVFDIPQLEVPNVVPGYGAGVFTKATCSGLNATLFAIYMDNNSPLDSIAIQPVLDLFKKLDLPVAELDAAASANVNSSHGNLYL